MESPTRSRKSPKEPSLPLPSLAGSKRPVSSLLPAFEPLNSSPSLPKPVKRQNTGQAHLKYPTPVSTSSTGILSSSPPRDVTHYHQASLRRPSLLRATSERAPLSAVPCVELSDNGETLMMGRSSNSSHYQLSANRLISRVHVKARYIPPSDSPRLGAYGKIEIICNGWNGMMLHCQGKQWELGKGDSFTSETEGTDLIVDVQDARVMIQWPRREAPGALSDSSWEDSPTRRNGYSYSSGHGLLQSSPLRQQAPQIASPVSPSPAHNLLSSHRLQALMPTDKDGEEGIQIYEDEPYSPEAKKEPFDHGVSMRTEATASFHSEIGEQDENENDPDEENDPIIHSFGPFGGNLSNRLASIMSKSPISPKISRTNHRLTLDGSPNILRPGPSLELFSSPKEQDPADEATPQREPSTESILSSIPEASPSPPDLPVDPTLINHIANQLAFARSSSTPLSTIMQHLPAESKSGLSADRLRRIIEASPTIGIITRSGKDAAGKPLESEYYYVPEGDDDELRRGLLGNGLGKPSLRACRKQHKQYYWKRPKTP